MSLKTWLVTGASRGLGLEIAKAALAAGHTVIATHRASKIAPPSIAELEQSGGAWIELDVAGDDVENKVEEVVKNYGKIDVLVNNAGFGLAGSIEDIR